MPRNGDFKKVVRARMKKTGESYSIARMRLAPDAPVDEGMYQVRISIKEIQPAIWRRVLVPAEITLADFHEVIQAAFGWWNYHLHQYIVRGKHYGVPDPEWADELPPMVDEREVTLRDLRGAGPIVYEYDFGDCWRHLVEIESLALPGASDTKCPVCIDGARACPHEDCGGVGGYEELVEILADPEHEEHRSMRTWAGEDYDPEKFSLRSVNAALRKLHRRSSSPRRAAQGGRHV